MLLRLPLLSPPFFLQALRDVIAAHTGVEPPPPPPRPDIASYGIVGLDESVPLLRALPELSSPEGIYADLPDTMEEYGQRCAVRLPAHARGCCASRLAWLAGHHMTGHAARTATLVCRRWGIILYRTWLPGDQLHREAVLDVSSPVHDYASVRCTCEFAYVVHAC